MKLYELTGLSELTFAKPVYDAINRRDVICIYICLGNLLNLNFLPNYHQISCGLNNLAGTEK